ncbi:MAG TPA: hypothetical protein VMZ30_22275 [Pyrinomonadaceae bacterium]|nr:hypothetical protein [Pyrinomonadaceae bacterium]
MTFSLILVGCNAEPSWPWNISGPRFTEPIMVKLLGVEADRIYVTKDTGDPLWLAMSEIKIG